MRVLGSLVSLTLVVGVAAACTGAGGASPSPAPSAVPSAAPSAAPSASAAVGERVDVIGTDYGFSHFGDSLDGPIDFAFRNEGVDLHEMIVLRKNDGVTEPFDELIALPQDEALAKVTMVGVAMAEAGQTAPEMVTASEPGEYLMICFIPQGTTSLPSQAPDASGPPEGLGDGPPHFTLGMMREFSIE